MHKNTSEHKQRSQTSVYFRRSQITHYIYIYSSRLGFVLTKPTVSSHEDSHFERSPPYRGKILPIFSYMSEHSLYTKLYHS